MSLKNNHEDWRWFSLFDPKTGVAIPGIEGAFTEDYEVDETYTEAEDEEDDEDDEDTEEEGNELAFEDEEDED